MTESNRNQTKQREQLQTWLREAEWARRQREETPDPVAQAPSQPVIEGPPPAAGQIRLWPPRDPCDEPGYALLMPGDYGHWLLIPFSPFATPATPEEYRLREAPPAQVLQLWNRRRVPRAVAAQSWCADTLSDIDLQRLREQLLRLEAGGPLDEDTCGPPLLHPRDPRHDYLDEEAARVTRALGEPFALEAADQSALRLAAEPGPDY